MMLILTDNVIDNRAVSKGGSSQNNLGGASFG